MAADKGLFGSMPPTTQPDKPERGRRKRATREAGETTKAAERDTSIPVRCKECKHASAFIDNSCHCRAFGRRVCACHRYGRVCTKYEAKAGE